MGSRKIDINPFNSIVSILFLVMLFVGLFFVAKGVFWVLSWLAPVFLLITLLVDYKVVVNYGKWVLNLLKTKIIFGIGAVLLTFFGFPVISGFLLAKALISKKLKKTLEQFENKTTSKEKEYATYEEVESDDMEMEDPLDLESEPTKVEKPEVIIKKKDSETNYEDLFE